VFIERIAPQRGLTRKAIELVNRGASDNKLLALLRTQYRIAILQWTTKIGDCLPMPQRPICLPPAKFGLRRWHMASEDIKAGDTVRVKSGGPIMTVYEVGEDSFGKMCAWCSWFDGKVASRDAFHLVVLEKVTPAVGRTSVGFVARA
jgi:uncharacterized protein YodC (DUF2158 family)